MRLLFVQRGYYIPDAVGGLQRNTQALIRRLEAQGCRSAVVATLSPQGRASFLHRTIRKIFPAAARFPDPFAGHPTYRFWNSAEQLDVVLRSFHPDLIVIEGSNPAQVFDLCLAQPVPVVWYCHDVSYRRLGLTPHQLSLMTVLACSEFLANALANELGQHALVVPPLIEPSAYRTTTSRREVLFINPIPAKGLDIAFALAAARPDIPFRFVQAWSTSEANHANLLKRAAALGNVRVDAPTDDMRPVFARAKILLAPSLVEEGFGRVVAEAQVSGIPTLASDRGGLPEAVGDGGIVMPENSDMASWSAALSRLWDDEAHYQNLCAAALRHAERPEFAPDAIVQRFLGHIAARLTNATAG